MALISAMRMLNSLENGTLSGAQLQTLLANNSRLGEWQVLLSIPSQARRIAVNNVTMTAVVASSTAITAVAASSTAMTAVIASSTAMTAVIASSTAMTAIAASSTAMTAVIASSTAMTAIAASSTAKMAIFNSDTALNAVAASSTALTTLRAAAQYTLYNGTANSSTAITLPSAPNAAGSYIVLGTSSGNAVNGTTLTLATRRGGSLINMTQTTNGTTASIGTTFPCAMPMVSPFTMAQSGGVGYQWYFGLLRCDI